MAVEIAACIDDSAVAPDGKDPTLAVTPAVVIAYHRAIGALDQGERVRMPPPPGCQRVGVDLPGLRHQPQGNVGQTSTGQCQALFETAVLGVEARGCPQRKGRINRPIDEGSRRWFESCQHGEGAVDRL